MSDSASSLQTMTDPYEVGRTNGKVFDLAAARQVAAEAHAASLTAHRHLEQQLLDDIDRLTAELAERRQLLKDTRDDIKQLSKVER